MKVPGAILFRGHKCSSPECRVRMNNTQKVQAANFSCGHIAHIGCLDNAYVAATATNRSLNFRCLRSNCDTVVTLSTLKQSLPQTDDGKTAFRGILLRILQEPVIAQNADEQNQRIETIDPRAQLICWVELGNSLSPSTQDHEEERVTLTARGAEPTLINRRFAYIRALELALTTGAPDVVQRMAQALIAEHMIAEDIDDYGGLVLNGVPRDREEVINWSSGLNLPFQNANQPANNAPAINPEALGQQANAMRADDPYASQNVHNEASIRLGVETYRAMQRRAVRILDFDTSRRQIRERIQNNPGALRSLDVICNTALDEVQDSFGFSMRQALCTVWSYISTQPEPLMGNLIAQLGVQLGDMIHGSGTYCYYGRMVRLLHTPLAIDHSLIDSNVFDPTQLVVEISQKSSKILQRIVLSTSPYESAGIDVDETELEKTAREQVIAWTNTAFTERGIDPLVTRQLIERAWPEGTSILNPE